MRDWRHRAFEPDREHIAVDDERAERLAKLRSDLKAAERVAAQYPEVADVTLRILRRIVEEIAKLEGAE